MVRVIGAVTALVVLTVCLVIIPKMADGADEPISPQEPKAQPPKGQDHKPAEPKKEETKKEELKKEESKGHPQSPRTESKPSEPASKAESKKEEPKPQAPAQKTQEAKPSDPAKLIPESKAPEVVPAKPVVPPIIPTKLALMADPRLLPYDISVEMNGETAELSGKVCTDAEKAAATEIAQGVEGVKSVTNKIEIVKDLGLTMAKRKDEIITQYVKDRFGKSKTLETAHFDVKAEDGVVLLGGKTKFLVIVLEAAEAARQVPGVKAVKTEGIRLEGGDEK